MKTIGEQAQSFREAKGWNYTRMAAEVSKAAGFVVSRQAITQLEEAGDRRPKYLQALAQVMGISVDGLLAGRYRIHAGPLESYERLADHIIERNSRRDAPEVPQPSAETEATQESSDELTIDQFETGGAMGFGFTLQDQPGVIRRWVVTPDWVQQNVHRITSPKNLAIVTGFGDSMRPLYNPGDPLLIDRGIDRADIDGIYFFRVGGEGFVKRLQRIPTVDGVILRAKSENPQYDPFDITKGMDFQVFGRVVKAWRGEEF